MTSKQTATKPPKVSIRFYDNTRIEESIRCMRRYYYRHVRDWSPISTALPLIFGSAWHKAMDIVWVALDKKPSMNTETLVNMAMVEGFCKEWDSHDHLPKMKDFLDLSLETQKEYLPRTPGVALEMLYYYIEARRSFIADHKVLAAEQGFAVPLDPRNNDVYYCGLLDKVVEEKRSGRIWGIEHKTTTDYAKNGFFKRSYLESFSPNSQIDGQLFAGNLLFPGKYKGVYVDAALVHRYVHEGFRLIPVEKSSARTASWFWHTRRRIEAIDRERAALKEYDPRSNSAEEWMPAYPQVTTSCTHYGGCPYLDLCKMSDNPARDWPLDPPPGYKEEHWSPFNELALAKLGFARPKED